MIHNQLHTVINFVLFYCRFLFDFKKQQVSTTITHNPAIAKCAVDTYSGYIAKYGTDIPEDSHKQSFMNFNHVPEDLSQLSWHSDCSYQSRSSGYFSDQSELSGYYSSKSTLSGYASGKSNLPDTFQDIKHISHFETEDVNYTEREKFINRGNTKDKK